MNTKLLPVFVASLFTLVLMACSSPRNASASRQPKAAVPLDSTQAKLDRFLRRQTAKGFKGSVYIVRNDQVLLNRSYGQPVSPKPLAYWIASNAKAVLALAIQKLEEDHKLSIQDPITKYFAAVPADKQHITLHQLLTHSSGYPQAYATDNTQTYQQALDASMRVPIKKEDIGTYQYSNDDYALLVLLVEKLTGKTYEQYVAKEIFRPAGLKHTGFWGYEQPNVELAPVFDPARAAKQPATMYKNGKSVVNYGQKGPSGLYSTAEDQYAIFKAMWAGKIISPANLAKAFQPHVPVSESEGIKTYYGYGWLVGYKGNQLVNIRHTGEETWLGHNSMRIFYPNGDGIVVLSNAHVTKDDDVWAVQVAYELEYRLQRLK
jgi:CubicO group peptidase (beta-lactamase class C family)